MRKLPVRPATNEKVAFAPGKSPRVGCFVEAPRKAGGGAATFQVKHGSTSARRFVSPRTLIRSVSDAWGPMRIRSCVKVRGGHAGPLVVR
jgi:hypothetical protein